MLPSQPNSEPSSKGEKLIFGRYRLIQSLGKGAFGEVFQAEDIQFVPPRMVAIKVLHGQYVAEPQVRDDLKREAGVLAQLNHPNILRVIDVGVTEELAFIITDLALGGSLSQRMRPNPKLPPVLIPLPEIATYLDQLADALDEAHAKGLVHRDIKPQNILLDQRNRPLLADFGLATAISSSASSMLVSTTPSGTPLYMAPEQWRGQAGRASDIYAMGVLLYQMITGYTPFQGNQFELMGQHLSAPIPRLSDRAPDLKYPAALDAVIAAVLAKDPRTRLRPTKELARRYREALDIEPETSLELITDRDLETESSSLAGAETVPLTGEDELTRPTNGRVKESTPPQLPEPVVEKKARSTGWLVGGGVLALLAVVVAIVLVVLLGSSNQSTPTASVQAILASPAALPTTTLPPATATIAPSATVVPTPTVDTVTPTVAPTASPTPTTEVATATPVPPTVAPTIQTQPQQQVPPVNNPPQQIPPVNNPPQQIITTRPPPPTATAVPPTPTPVPCSIATQRGFGQAYAQPGIAQRLGCPTADERQATLAYQPFNGGAMIFVQAADQILVLYNNGNWQSFPNTWLPSEPQATPPSGASPCPAMAVNGFGKLWATNAAVRGSLGCPIQAENSSTLGASQTFNRGSMFFYPNAVNGQRIFVLYGDGTYLNIPNTFAG